MTSRRQLSKRWLWSKFAILLVCTIAFHTLIFNNIQAQRDHIAQGGFDSPRLEVLSRLKKEFYLLVRASEGYVFMEGGVSKQDVERALDVFWSRVKSGTNDSYARLYGEAGVDMSVVNDLDKALPEFEVAVRRLQAGLLSSLDPVRALSARFAERINTFDDLTGQVRIARLQHTNADQWTLFEDLKWFQIVLSVYGIGLLLLLLAELLWANQMVSTLSISNAENKRLADSDQLTGLHNRRSFDELLRRLLAPDASGRFAVIAIDMDRFSGVNSAFGHATGDRVLIETGRRLRELAPGAFVARLSGDEFALVLNDADGPAARRLANRIAIAGAQPVDIGDRHYQPSFSMGIVECSAECATSPEQLLLKANAAVATAKSRGRGQIAVFQDDMMAELRLHAAIEADLRFAIDRDQIEIVAQPKVGLTTGRVAGFEALARWHHPLHGWINPEKFCRVADSTGLSLALGRAVTDKACALTSTLKTSGFAGRISINVSPAFGIHPDFVASMRAIVADHGLLLTDIEIEVTEEALFSEIGTLRANLAELQKHGATVAIDDFGKGYSSLSRLTQVAPNVIKVDKSAIDSIAEDPATRAVLRSIVGLAEALRLDIVVEGIEKPEQADIMSKLGVEIIQGYLISRPLPPLKAIAWFGEWTASHPNGAGARDKAVA